MSSKWADVGSRYESWMIVAKEFRQDLESASAYMGVSKLEVMEVLQTMGLMKKRIPARNNSLTNKGEES